MNDETIRTEADRAYEERNRLVALLARIYPSGLRKTDIEGWDPEWHGCVFIETPAGQLSWHYHDRDAHLFEGIGPYTPPWDGHTTGEKYARVERLVREMPPRRILISGARCPDCNIATYHVHKVETPPETQPCHQCLKTLKIEGWLAKRAEGEG